LKQIRADIFIVDLPSKQEQISHAIEANKSRYLYILICHQGLTILSVSLPPPAPHITTAAAAKQYQPRD